MMSIVIHSAVLTTFSCENDFKIFLRQCEWYNKANLNGVLV